MPQQWFYKLMVRQFGTISSYLGRILLAFFIALATELLPAIQGLSAEGPSANNSPSASNVSADLEKKIYQSIKDLDYSDQVASDFVKMIHPWKCEVLYQKLSQTIEDVKQKKISPTQYAQVEEEVINWLAQKIKKEIRGVDTTIKSNDKYFDLALIIRENKAHCLGYSQLFYILGNSMGLTIQAIDVVEYSQGPMPAGTLHVACAVGLHNGMAMQVDLTLRDCVSRTFLFTEEYGKSGNYWELKDKNNRLDIHPRIQLNKNGLVAGIHNSRGATYDKSGQIDKAITEYTKAIELNPKSAEAYTNRGATFGKSRQSDKSISDCTKAIELNPRYAEAYIIRGATYIKAGQPDKSLSDCNKAIELNPNSAEAYGNRGLNYALLGKKDDAKKDLRKAMQLNPSMKESVKRISDQFKLDL